MDERKEGTGVANVLIQISSEEMSLAVERPNPVEYMKSFYLQKYGAYWEIITAGRDFDAVKSVLTSLVKTATNQKDIDI